VRRRTALLPRVDLFNAVSLDGRFDQFEPDIELYYRLAARFREDATLVGSNTLLEAPDKVDIPPEDDSVFEPPESRRGDRRPLLVVPDSRGRLKTWHFWRQQPYWRGWVALCSHSTPQRHIDYLRKRHVDRIVAGTTRVDLGTALRRLRARYGVKRVRVDSGGTLGGALLRAGLVSEVCLLVHPCLVGGTSPRTVFSAPDLNSPRGVIAVELKETRRLRHGILWLRYRVRRRSGGLT